MDLNSIYRNLFADASLTVSEEELSKVRRCHDFLKDFVADKVIYGINTGFGPHGTVACR